MPQAGDGEWNRAERQRPRQGAEARLAGHRRGDQPEQDQRLDVGIEHGLEGAARPERHWNRHERPGEHGAGEHALGRARDDGEPAAGAAEQVGQTGGGRRHKSRS